MKRAKSRHKKYFGFTLTEIAIVLGIIGLILGSIWAASAAVYNNLRVAKAQQELVQITQAIRSMYATTPVMDTTAGTTDFINAGVFPAEMLIGGGTSAYDPWGGAVTIASSSAGGANGSGFTVTLSATSAQMPSSACIRMVQALAADPTIYLVSSSSSSNVPLPTTATAINSLCGTGTTQLGILYSLKGTGSGSSGGTIITGGGTRTTG